MHLPLVFVTSPAVCRQAYFVVLELNMKLVNDYTISFKIFSVPSIRTSSCCQYTQVVVMKRIFQSQMSSGPTVGLVTVMVTTRVCLTALLPCHFPWVLDPASDVRSQIYRWHSLQQRWDVNLYRRSNWYTSNRSDVTVAYYWTIDRGVESSWQPWDFKSSILFEKC